MKVYHSLEEFPGAVNPVVTIGTFDGVHAGHLMIIRRLKEIALATKGETVVLTFFPHPRLVLQPEDNELKLITTMGERMSLLERHGIDHLIILPFSREFSRMSAVEFVRDILVQKIGTNTLVIGYDHHFGRNREGSYKDLEEMAVMYNYQLEEIPKHVINEVSVSSTKIRKHLAEGEVAEANNLLGHDFLLEGKVIEGDRIGKDLGFPTANFSIDDPFKLIPRHGIYAAEIEVKSRKFKGMLYIGTRPVVDGMKLSIEVNIFDFNENIYGESIRVYLKHWIRPDMKFSGLDELKKKMQEDKLFATKLLS
ncbi:MAG: bifunctional riboflavin kinase/FAD synthetase [Bacteroidetes bacterium]|nr:MAG: bifunctional riboflavin kinase/FAD synthetase [Bacteroidota bacterium]REK00386.1 MAG: bifunctional riboflavin kinase/FAD synthetase [Bacteroidota bacterium]REK35505.1 MAG: bifunctional riboflavin kinase/FAD synthetase [Bacteroidota bacterium]REK46859.1 MAG: bifunctional riboflavin kinase/FAD synthetase [Bacteroidota bacterium]